ncbi:hypothetical protein LIER_24929 [Lithospermum erythrorhizon]|uniref:Uncharacterized protein n=1 Tax=Lithospermum erythrorhizon TaxID=34254 RepID=A0AAV3R4C3_LITER
MTGRLFDEVVTTTAECLSLTLDSDVRPPWSCRFLILAYHRLASHSPDATVFISEWIVFGSHSLRTYVGYEAADRSTMKIAPASVCPHGPITLQHHSWDSSD